MSELANYSIETDHLVWLSFKDGKNLRVPVGQLPRYLAPRDLQRVRRAMRLRRDFLKHHMPGPLLILVAVGVVLAVFAGERAVAMIWQQTHPAPAGEPPTEIVRSLPSESGTGSGPSPMTSPAPNAATAIAAPAAAKPKKVPAPPRVSAKLKAPAVAVTPIAVPASDGSRLPDEIAKLPEVPTNPPTTAEPTPTPAPNAGSVLGDSDVKLPDPATP